MISNYTKNVTVDTNGDIILEFDVDEIDSCLITPNQDIYIGFSDLSQALFPILANSSFSIRHDDFKNQTMEKIYGLIKKFILKEDSKTTQGTKIVRVYAKGQSVSATISINYLGGNR